MNTESKLKSTPPRTTPTLRPKPTFNHKRQKKEVAGDVSTVVGVQIPPSGTGVHQFGLDMHHSMSMKRGRNICQVGQLTFLLLFFVEFSANAIKSKVVEVRV